MLDELGWVLLLRYVQKVTFDSYLYKTVQGNDPVGDLKLGLLMVAFILFPGGRTLGSGWFFFPPVWVFFPPMHCNWFSCEGAGFPSTSRALFPPLPPCGVCWVLLGPLRCSAWCPALKDLCVLEVQGFLWTSWVRSACFCVEFVLLWRISHRGLNLHRAILVVSVPRHASCVFHTCAQVSTRVFFGPCLLDLKGFYVTLFGFDLDPGKILFWPLVVCETALAQVYLDPGRFCWFWACCPSRVCFGPWSLELRVSMSPCSGLTSTLVRFFFDPWWCVKRPWHRFI